MTYLGKYNGVKCYKCYKYEYEDLYYRGACEDVYYIIDGGPEDGAMVRDNIIKGFYNGRIVNEMCGGRFCAPKTYHASSSTGTKEYGSMELKVSDIDFTEYSKVVDKFFESLN